MVFFVATLVLALDVLPPCIIFGFPLWVGPAILAVLYFVPPLVTYFFRWFWFIAWAVAIYLMIAGSYPVLLIVLFALLMISKFFTTSYSMFYNYKFTQKK